MSFLLLTSLLCRHYMRERDEELLQKEQARHVMLAPLRGQQLKNYVTDIRNQLNTERNAEKKAAYLEAVTKYVFYVYFYATSFAGNFYCTNPIFDIYIHFNRTATTGQKNKRPSFTRRDSRHSLGTRRLD